MINKIIEEIKKGLTGDPAADIAYLQQQGTKYLSHPNSAEILKILSDMSFELLPEENQKRLKEIMFIDGKRIDQIYNDAMTEMNKGNIDAAIDILAKIESKIDSSFDMDNSFSFRNRLEEYIYVNIYKPEKNHTRTPFDLCKYLSAYGYLLVEKREPAKAAEKLKKAIRYNPVNIEPRFELAESYKLAGESEKLLECTREALKICITPEQIARCYTNLGYYCIDIKDYDSAVAFYYESLLYAENPNVQGELQHIAALKEESIDPPERKDILAAFDKYGIKNGPDQNIVNITYSLGCYCMEHNAPPQESLFYMQLVYELTHDKKVQETIDMLNAQIVVQKSKNENQ